MPPALKLITDHTSEAAPVAEFAEAMSALASGVVLVTCWVGDRPWGMTVTAFASVSADAAKGNPFIVDNFYVWQSLDGGCD